MTNVINPMGAINPFYLDLINKFIDSKKSDQTNTSSLHLVSDAEAMSGVPNFLIRIRDRKGQLDFCAITEDGRLIDTEFLWHYRSDKNLHHDYHMRYCDQRYYLFSLKDDLMQITTDIKLVYLILASPKIEKQYVFTLDQISNMKICDSANLPNIEEFEDQVDQYYKRMSKVKNLCPNCGNEWNDDYCHHCGHPH